MNHLRICLCALLAIAAAPASAESVLRVVPQSDLRVLDPHVTQATVTAIYGLMVYDTLYSMDEGMRPHPQWSAPRPFRTTGSVMNSRCATD
jgi:peptide/nickel transport system substrate-binding protein